MAEVPTIAAAQVRKSIQELLGLEKLPGDSDRWVEDLEADSLDAMELIILVEEKLNVEIFDREWEKLKTVGDWVALAERKVRERA